MNWIKKLLGLEMEKKCAIHNVSHTFLREGKTITNQKFVTTPKPKIKPAPQKLSKNYG